MIPVTYYVAVKQVFTIHILYLKTNGKEEKNIFKNKLKKQTIASADVLPWMQFEIFISFSG